jgi:hypothetical protein
MRLRQIILIAAGVLALVVVGVLLVGYVRYGWRLDSSTLNGGIFSKNENTRDERVAARHWDLDLVDSAVVVIEASEADVEVRAASQAATVDALLAGDGTDSARYIVTVQAKSPRELHVTAVPHKPYVAGARNKIIVQLDRPVRMIVKIGSGDLDLDGLRGELSATVTRGNLDVSDLSGTATLKALEGRVDAQRCRGSLTAEADGEVSLDYDDAETSVTASGAVTIRNHSGTLTASNLSGGINASMIGLGRACRLTALAGDVRMEALPGIRATFNASAPAGRVMVGLPLDSADSVAPDPRLLRGRINGGGVPVVLTARHGDVIIAPYEGN